ncbi:MAG: chemotaxis response regulator protein-glutamate methylesterase [Bacteroidetes bacterium CG2_30_32_10]|nr:MAG: chemotaxis response regulator protein-glutamate methylesterase [Bacteroidetes bacterium CG2_30_32_10]
MKKYKVLIVDDSAVVRQTLTSIFQSDKEIEVIGVASDPYIAAHKIQDEIPDVITLDIEMPRMDGLTFLRKIMTQHPIPVVIISSLTEKGSQTAIRALEYGAIDIITKPKLDTKKFFEESKIRLCDAVKAAAISKIERKKMITPTLGVTPKLSADVILQKAQQTSMLKTTELVVAVGASTGGTEALREFLEALPHDSPGIIIVQHMPEMFTRSFANRLNELCRITVKEAENNDSVLRGRALIAPGNYHMLLKRSGARYYVEIKSGPLVNRHRPSVDVLFRSTAKYAGANAIGIIMTGMGDDGAKGLLEMKEAGAFTIAQDEKSCVVFGMPKEAIKLGGVDKILPLEHIANFVINKK